MNANMLANMFVLILLCKVNRQTRTELVLRSRNNKEPKCSAKYSVICSKVISGENSDMNSFVEEPKMSLTVASLAEFKAPGVLEMPCLYYNSPLMRFHL